MKINWFFGPQRESFVLDDQGEARAGATVPFHGIVSRGMLELLEREGVSHDVWLGNAHLVFLRGRGEPCATTRELGVLKACAAESKTLSFGESAACVRIYLENHCPSAYTGDGPDVWNIKEGHTSSVWRVSLPGLGGEETEFIVNVARDQAANAELEATSLQMRRIRLGCPDINMAGVQDIQTVQLHRGQDVIDVIVTRNEWVSNSNEIHAVYDAKGRPRHYLLVERFLTSADAPAHIVSIYGRRFSEQECQRINDDMARFVERASEVVASPHLNVNEGDLVWDGRRAVVVAISQAGSD